MKLIVGLGNPEDKYNGTRHNLGFDLLDHYVADKLSVTESNKFWSFNKDFKSLIGEISCQLPAADDKLLLIKPQTYMNNSGLAVAAVAKYYQINPEDIIILHDDLDITVGKLKIRLGGAAAGHHGVESIIDCLKTDKFIRVRLGIGTEKSLLSEKEGNGFVVEKFVLNKFDSDEKSKIKHITKQIADILDLLLENGVESAQNQFN